MTRASLPRRSPFPRLFLLCAALLALAAFLAQDAPPAQAGHTLDTPSVWAMHGGNGRMSVHWDPVADATHYSFQYGVANSGNTSTIAVYGAAHISITGLDNGHPGYSFRVRAHDSGGTHTQSAWSNWGGGVLHASDELSASPLVKNFDRTPLRPSALGADGYVNAQAFTTGSSSLGYELTGVGMIPGTGTNPSAAERAQIRAELWSATAAGQPDFKLADLSVPTSLTGGSQALFTAPLHTRLEPDTTYLFLLYTTGSYDLQITAVEATTEDSGHANGWDLNGRSWRNTQTSSGSGAYTPVSAQALRVNVRGFTIPEPNQQRALASTIGASGTGTGPLSSTQAQSFTTGANHDGFALSSIEVHLGTTGTLSAADIAALRAELWSNDPSGAQGDEPDEKILDLRVPSSVTAGNNAFTAPGGTVLEPWHIYWVVLYQSGYSTSNVFIRKAQGNPAPQDAGGAPGWTIPSSARSAIGTSPGPSTNWLNSQDTHRIRINGALNRYVDPHPVLSNHGQATGASYGANNFVNAQSFTTGSIGIEYPLHSIEAVLESAPRTKAERDSIRAELWSVDTNGNPDAILHPLSVPDHPIPAGRVAFKPPSGTTLTAETSYHFVLYTTGTWDMRMDHVTATDEDEPKTTGWTIGDQRHHGGGQTPADVTTWTAANNPLRITVRLERHVGPPRDLEITGGDEQLALSWTGRTGQTIFEIDYTSSSTVAAEAANVSDPATGWTAGTSGANIQATSHTITGLTNNVEYRVRVRSINSDELGVGSYAFGTGTPSAGSSNNNLSALTVTTDSEAPVTLSPTFSAATTSYTATVASSVTAVYLTPTVADTGKATVEVGKSGSLTSVTSGSDSGYISLDVGANAIIVRVTAENRTTRDYTVTVTRQAVTSPPAARASLDVAPGDAQLSLRWPGGGTVPVTGYDLHYTSSTTVADGTTASGSDATAAWVDLGHTGVETTRIITGLTNNLEYRVRVRAVNSVGSSAWTFARGTPTEKPAVSLAVSPNPVTEGSGVAVTVRLSRSHTGSVTIPLVITDVTAEPEDHGALASITIAAGQTVGSGSIATAQDTDSDDETFSVALGALPATVEAGSPTSVEVTITDDEGEGGGGEFVGGYGCPETGRIWFTTMTAGRNTPTAGQSSTGYGIGGSDPGSSASKLFAHEGALYQVEQVSFNTHDNVPSFNNLLILRLDKTWTDAMLAGLALHVDGGLFHLADSTKPGPAGPATRAWSTVLDWSSGQEIKLCLTESIVTLSASPRQVTEGESVTVTARLSRPLGADVDIPLTTEVFGAEPGDFTSPSRITIAAGETVGTGTIVTNQDEDTGDEWFEVDFGGLPASVQKGYGRSGAFTSVSITIFDDDEYVPSPDPYDLRVSEGNGRLDLTWNAPETGGVTGYEVQYSLNPDSGWQAVERSGTETAQAITGLSNERLYWLRVRAVRVDGNSRWATATGRPTASAPGNPHPPPPPQAVLDSIRVHYDGITSDYPDGVDGFRNFAVARRASYGYRSFIPGEYPSIDQSKGIVQVTHAKLMLRAANPDVTVRAGKVTYDYNPSDGSGTRARSVTLMPVTLGELSHTIELNADSPNTPVDIEVTDGDVVTTWLLDIDPPPRTYSLGPAARAVEGQDATLNLTLSQPAPEGGLEFTVTAAYPVGGASAEDVGTITSPVTVPEGGTTLEIAVPTVDDDQYEGEESFTVTVASAVAGWAVDPMGTATATVAIEDNDEAPTGPEPRNVRVAPGDGALTVTWTVAPREGVADNDIRHALRWSQEPGVWANPRDPKNVGTNDGITVAGGVTSYVITGLKNDVATGVFVRSYTGGRHDEQSPQSSRWVRVKGEHTTPRGAEQQQAAPAGTYSVTAAASAIEGGNAALTITLSGPAPAGGVAFTVTAGHSAGGAAADDVGAIATPVTAPEGEATLDLAIPTVNDDLDEDDENFTVTVAAVTAGWEKAGDGKDTATVTIEDDDTAGVTVSAANPLNVAEGGTATYTVVLDSRPTADVTITPASGDAGAASVSPASHTFEPSNWNTPATFTVSGVADDDSNDESVGITHGVSGDDARYAAVLLSTVSVAVSDSTQPGQQQQTPTNKYADLIAQMYEWRNGPEAQQYGRSHTHRWDRALLAFGETVSDATVTPMTAAQAQALADQAWGTRWAPVARALWEIEGNRAPTVAAAIADATIVSENGMRTVSLSGVFSDADNDALTITAESSNNAVATVSVAADQSSLAVSAQSRGTATIVVTAADGKVGAASDSFTVTVKAAPVVTSALADVSSLEEGESQDVSLSGVFSDADGDTLAITAASSDNAVATVTVAADQSTLTIAGVAEGTATITVTAEDSDGNRVSDRFDVLVEPEPAEEQGGEASDGSPTVVAPIADFSLEGPEMREIDLTLVFQDPNGDKLTFKAASSKPGVAAAVWFDSDRKKLTVLGNGTGTATITVTAEDPDGNTVSDAFEVTVRPAGE